MVTWLSSWAYHWQWINPYLSGAIVLASMVGASFSTYAYWHTWVQLRQLRVGRINGVRQSVLHLHLVTHAGIWGCQIILCFVSLAIMTLPEMPLAMYDSPEGRWTLTVLAGRKFGRLFTSMILLAVAHYKVRWLRRVAR